MPPRRLTRAGPSRDAFGKPPAGLGDEARFCRSRIAPFRAAARSSFRGACRRLMGLGSAAAPRHPAIRAMATMPPASAPSKAPERSERRHATQRDGQLLGFAVPRAAMNDLNVQNYPRRCHIVAAAGDATGLGRTSRWEQHPWAKSRWRRRDGRTPRRGAVGP